MIVSHIIGGLGNQMFQYANGRALSLAHNESFLLNIRDFLTHEIHQGFELERIFSCQVALAKPEDMRSVLGWQASRLVCRLMARPDLRFLRNKHFVVEPHFHYWAGIQEVSSPCYLKGYWQSERYFADVDQTIRADFTFQQPLTGRNLDLAQEVSSINAVSLHVRRGDYASNPKTQATHGVCPLAYYQAAIKHIAEHVEAPQFFLFSDDMEWVRGNLDICYPYRYVDHNCGTESYNDMHLMSLCKHHIIANSSFSWWGAWLGTNSKKIVIAPSRWFHSNKADTQDICPDSWIRL